MHKVYENDDLMMYVRKRYCHCCGGVLERKRTERIVRKGDPDHLSYCMVGTSYKPHGDILVIGKEYYCPACHRALSCDMQEKVLEAQKHYQRKIVSEEEIALVQNDQRRHAISQLLRYRWLLLLPVVGSLICSYMVFNGRLCQMTEKKDGAKLLMANMLVFLGVALVIKIVLGFFSDVEFLNNNKSIIMLIPALLSFNIPALWYINRTFQ
jgi:hypothetical protein